MKFGCERDLLADALATAGRGVSTRSSGLPALSGIHFQCEDNRLKLVGTDLDLTVEVTIEVNTHEPGTCVIPARLIADIVKALPSGAVTLETDGEEAHVSAGRAQFSVRTYNAQEFPKLTANDNYTATLKAFELTEALRQVVRAASSDDSRPVLTGVLMSSEQDGLRLVATDSYRLAITDIPGAQILQADQSVLIPSKALAELNRLLGAADEVKVALEDRELSFSVGNVRLTSRLIEGQFPDYRPLLPSNYPNQLRIDRDLLLDAVRRVKLLVKDNTTPVRLALRSDGVELTVVSQEIGQATDDVEAKYEGEAITVAFNPAYLIDGLEAVPAGDVLIETIDALKPATLKADNTSDFLYLIMPVRVS
jgi:DNA polymerase III subunit beta